MTFLERFLLFWKGYYIEEVLPRVYTIPRVSFYGRHIGAPSRDTNMASPYKAHFPKEK